MSQRKYTIKEIDELREVMEHKYLFGTYSHEWSRPGPRESRTFYEKDKLVAVEEMVRTAMLGGITAAECLASEARRALLDDPA
jgi:hypothetical protein